MEICALASGSSGNCFYIGNSEEAILIDVGISAKQVCEKLANRGKSAENIKAIFITHEHIDHVKGVDVLARKLNIPIFTTKGTLENCFLCSEENLIRVIKNDSVVKIGKIKIEAFSKSHHATDPVSYNAVYDKKVSIITDAGYGCKNIKKSISDSDFLIMEANYDENMLYSGPYPVFLKKLIGSDIGHMSNKQAALCVAESCSKKLNNILLAHLSRTNNTPSVALETFNSFMKERKDISPLIDVSIKDQPSKLFRI